MNKFLTVAFATILLTSTAMAEDRKVTVPMPKSITVTCSDTVRPGTVVMSNPPKFSCQDYVLAKAIIGTGITVGPDATYDRIARALRRVKRQNRVLSASEIRQNERNTQLVNRSKREIERSQEPRVYMDNSWRDIGDTSLDDFDKRFPGINRNAKFFVSDTSSCRGWVNIQKILNGESKEVKVRVQ